MTCCCCIPLRAGVIILALVSFLAAGFEAVVYLAKPQFVQPPPNHTTALVYGIFMAIMCFFSFIGLIGGIRASYGMVKAYSVLQKISLFLAFVATGVTIGFSFKNRPEMLTQCIASVKEGTNPSINLPTDATEDSIKQVCEPMVTATLVAMTITMVIILLIMIYFTTVVSEYASKLKVREATRRMKLGQEAV
jgi:ABC-type multidrug transport system fused ATPase/permease subunit